MEYESLISGTKWEILSAIAHHPQSPLQLAEQLGTTVANISTQLRLLEAAQLVSKSKTGRVKAGKPRLLYSLQQDAAYVVGLSNGMAFKKYVHLSPYQKSMLALWKLNKTEQAVLSTYLHQHPFLFDHNVYVKQKFTLVVQTKTTSAKSQKISFGGSSYQIHIECSTSIKQPPPFEQICFGGDTQ